jgi:ATP-dependent RNA helicase SUPV3L1/SUV3
VLVRRLRENAMLETDISKAGEVVVEGHPIGRLVGFQFAADAAAAGPDAKALRAAAQKALAGEIENRAMRLQAAPDEQFVLASDGAIRWTGEPVGKLVAGDDVLHPRIRLIADERLTGASRDAVQARLDLWLKTHIEKGLAPVFALAAAEDVTGIARGVAFQLVEALGVLERHKVAEELKALDQAARGTLRKYGVRFGAYHVYLPALLKPAPRVLAAHLWALKNGGPQLKGIDELPHLAGSGRTSMPVDKEISKALYRTIGYRVCGERAVRVDILERLADLIRPLLAWRPGAAGDKPVGAVDGGSFTVTMAMTSLTGASPEDFASVLRSLGYRMERRPKPASPPAEADAGSGATPPAMEGPEPANADADGGSEATCEVDVALPAADGVIASAADMPADPATAPEASKPTAADGSKPAAADDDVIEVWRPGRPEERRHRRPPARPRREPHVEPRGPQAPTPIAAAAMPAAPAGGGQAVMTAEVAAKRRNDRAAAARAPTGPKGRGEAKDRREKAPDPNSPFAKLAVLKAQLEARSKERH